MAFCRPYVIQIQLALQQLTSDPCAKNSYIAVNLEHCKWKFKLVSLSPLREFYKAVENLRRFTDQPSEEHSYRTVPPTQSTRHLLKAGDEMQLCDNIAVLAQWQEGVENVTAVTLQEKAHGLVICLAGNHMPSETVVHGLQEVITLVSDYASRSSLSARQAPISE